MKTTYLHKYLPNPQPTQPTYKPLSFTFSLASPPLIQLNHSSPHHPPIRIIHPPNIRQPRVFLPNQLKPPLIPRLVLQPRLSL